MAARLAFDKIIQPAAIRFQPNIILISAGYDAHWRDPLEKLNFYSSTYHFLTRRVKQLSNKLCGKNKSLLSVRCCSVCPYPVFCVAAVTIYSIKPAHMLQYYSMFGCVCSGF